MGTVSRLLTLALAALAAAPACATAQGAGSLPTSDDWRTVPRTHEPVRPVAPAPPTEYADRRVALARTVGGPSAVWVEARGFDELDPFFQDDDFYYLSGVEIPDIALLLVIGADGELEDEVLFLPPHDPVFELWNGARLAPGPEAATATGFRSTRAMPGSEGEPADWPALLGELDVERVHTLETPDWEAPAGVTLASGGRRESDSLRSRLDAQRLIKSAYEIACLKTAIDITCHGLRNALTEIRPGAYEYQAQGALEGTFLRLGGERAGFSSICGSGPNSVTLHYNANRRRLENGDMIVMDVGTKYQYYCADVTRTVPVNGTFTPRQREIYEIVLAAQTAAAEAAKPGMTIKDLDTIARKVIEDHGFTRKDFPHSVGHWIGLDVHDVGGRAPIEIGALFTIEPGIYLPDENLGVRIEDDYLMTSDGAVKLSVGIPSDPDELEALLASIP